ncbi:MAG: DUF1156 domain-containing protein [Solirubrobacterales bacterium]|nr:DUF1156 domain-containing protein [Solirubrobacterales bacterium]
MSSPRVMIEEWLPTVELGIESRRERGAANALPPISFLHIWWARRPLVAAAGTVLGSVLPAWSSELADAFPTVPEFQDETSYRQWFLRLCGIWGDPVAAKQRIAIANATGEVLGSAAYGYKQAFHNSPDSKTIDQLHQVLSHTWGRVPLVCDPTAGGGSIPFEATRYGLRIVANDLNPIATSILRASIRAPSDFGASLVPDIREWGTKLTERIKTRLLPFFDMPAEPRSDNNSYIFARTVACPRTGKTVPLVPNWWLRKGDKGVAVRLITEQNGVELETPEFEVVAKRDIDFDADNGTVAGGMGVSPWDQLAIEGDYIKSEAKAGRMGSILYAVATRVGRVRGFRAPDQIDLDSIRAAESELERLLPMWEAEDVIPDETRYIGPADRSANYGISHHRDLFSPRQLLVHGTFVEEFRKLTAEIHAELGTERGDAVLTEIGMMQGKAVNWNAALSSWNAARQTMRSVFDRHDFAFKWTYAEFEGASELFPWCLDQVVGAYQGICELIEPSDADRADVKKVERPVPTITAGNGADLDGVDSGSVELVCIDPPYYDNVMYAELADFFYVWEKRTLGRIHPDLFVSELTDKQNEAVANPARFADFGPRRKELANQDYQAKMEAIFAESSRILRDDGVMTVMFTHKKAEAWDTLGTALMEAGFTIETSWPVNTEFEHSLHQAKKNAAASTIMLVCRKRAARLEGDTNPYFDDLEAEVRAAAREAMERFSNAGIEGVDLLLATYGPALSVISSAWPVYSSEADDSGRSLLLRPEQALEAAREELVSRQIKRLVGTEANLDPLTDFAMIAWDTFRAAEFPFDEARRLALAVGGLDVDDLVKARLLEKKAGSVVMLEPKKRVRRGDDPTLPGVRPAATEFGASIDAVHTLIYVADVDGVPAARALIARAGIDKDEAFLACFQGLVNSIPRTKDKGEWVRPEAATLDLLATTCFPDIQVPIDPDPAYEEDDQQELDLSGT